jgi:hypothetical protein
MDRLKGRVTDLVVLPNGAGISGEYLTTIIDDNPEAGREFQFRQAKELSIRLFVVPNNRYDGLSEALPRAHDHLQCKTSLKVPVSIELVDGFPGERGKLRYVISYSTQSMYPVQE